MKKMIYVLILMLTLSGCTSNEKATEKLNVAVTIQPEIGFVEAVMGDLGTVTAVIPPGNSPANYQPSPKELTAISDADVYFSIGVPAEHNILPKIISNKTDVVSLLDTVEEVYPLRQIEKHVHKTSDEHHEDEGDHDHEDAADHDHENKGDHDHEDAADHDHENEGDHDHEDAADHDHKDAVDHENEADHDHHHEGVDPHIWMSPKRVIVMIEKIAETLSNIDPQNKEHYDANAKSFITELEALDQEIKDTLADSNLESFIIYHPSMGYFADDYNLEMHVIEEGGKEATINTMTNIIQLAKEKDIKVVFYQEEFDSKQAKIIASEINGRAIPLDVLSKDYVENMKKLLNLLLSN